MATSRNTKSSFTRPRPKTAQEELEVAKDNLAKGLPIAWYSTATFPTSHEVAGFPSLSPIDTALQTSALTGISTKALAWHGIGKTASVQKTGPLVLASLGIENAQIVLLNGPNCAPGDLYSGAPTRVPDPDNPGHEMIVLKDMLVKGLMPGCNFALVCDDFGQAHPETQNAILQLAAEWRIGTDYNLRKLGCVAVLFLDNPSLAETTTVTSDPAMLDRFITFTIRDTEMGTANKVYLAGKHPTLDLTKVFSVRDSLPSELRYIWTWRGLDHAIDLALAGLPPMWSLPYLNGSYKYLEVKDKDTGRVHDRTTQVFTSLCAALGVPFVESVTWPVDKLLDAAFDNKWSIRIIGTHGVGKTELVKAKVAERGWDLIDLSVPITDFDTKVCPIPTPDGELQMALEHNFVSKRPKVIKLDEANRVDTTLKFARIMELTQEWSLGGVKIPNLQAIVQVENPPIGLAGRKYDVTNCNISQADRFTATIVMDANDVDFSTWLCTKLPTKMASDLPLFYAGREAEIEQIAKIVTTWYSEDLEPKDRIWVSPRNLERLIKAHFAGADLDSTKLWLGYKGGQHEFAPISLANLRAALAKRPMARLSEIAANLDEWVDKLKEANAASSAGAAATDAVDLALMTSELRILEEHFDTVTVLFAYMPPNRRLCYFREPNKDVQAYWRKVFAAFAQKSAEYEASRK